MTANVRVTGREDVLAATPYLLGFHPGDSIVLLGMRRHKLTLTARANPGMEIPDIIASFAKGMNRLGRIRRAMLLAYGPAHVAHIAVAVHQGLTARGFEIVEVLRVTDERYHCLLCDQCTPVSGAPFDLAASPVTAAATSAGLTARASREAVDRLVRPIGALAAVAMEQAVDRAEQRLASVGDHAELRRMGRQVVDDVLALASAGERLDDDQIAWLSLFIADDDVRDHAWAQTDDEPWQLDLWLDLTRRAEPLLAAPFASLLGWCAWRQGDGVLAVAALERARRIDPAYQMAAVLLHAIDEAHPPTSIRAWPPPGKQARESRLGTGRSVR